MSRKGEKVVYLPLGGLNAGGVEPRLVQRGSLKVENFIRERDGALTTRHGVREMSGTYTDRHMATYKDRPVVFGDTIKVHDGSTATSGTLSAPESSRAKGMLLDVEVVPRWQQAGESKVDSTYGADAAELRSPSMCLKDDVLCIVYTQCVVPGAAEEYRVKAVTIDYQSRAVLATLTLGTANSSGSLCGRVVDAGVDAKMHIVVPDEDDLIVYPVDTSDGSIDAGTTLAGGTDLLPGPDAASTRMQAIDVVSAGDGTYIFVAYTDTDADIRFVLIDVSSTPTVADQSDVTTSGQHTFSFCQRDPDTDYSVVLVYGKNVTNGSSGGVYFQVMKPLAGAIDIETVETLLHTGVTNFVQMRVAAVCTSTTSMRVFWDQRDASAAQHGDPHVYYIQVDDITTTPDLANKDVFLWNVSLWTQPVMESGGDIIVGLYYQDTANSWRGKTEKRDEDDGLPETTAEPGGTMAPFPSNPTFFFARYDGSGDAKEHRIIGECLRSRAGMCRDYNVHLNETRQICAEPQVCKPQLASANNWIVPGSMEIFPGVGKRYETMICEIKFTNVVTACDAKEVDGLLHIPNSCPYIFDGQQLVEAGFLHGTDGMRVTKSSGSLTQGTYLVASCYEWVDANGGIHRSNPKVLAIDVGASEDLDIMIPYYRFGRRQNVRLVVFISDAENSTILKRWQSIENDSTRATQFWDLDYTAKATFGNEEELYIAGNVLGHDTPLGHRISVEHQERIVYIPTEYEDLAFYYSKRFLPGEGTAFNGLLRKSLPTDGGVYTAAGSMDGRLFLFKEDRTYVVRGGGLDDQGGGQNFSDALLLNGAIGCVNRRSVVNLPGGLAFESRDGIYLITHSLQFVHIGKNVKYFTDTYTVSRGLLVPAQKYAIWFCEDDLQGDGSERMALVYFFDDREWSVFPDHAAFDACLAHDVYYLKQMDDDGNHNKILVQDTSQRIDDNGSTNIVTTIETGHFSFHGIQAYGRFKKLIICGYKHANHTLRVKLAYDGDPVWTDSQDFAAGTALKDFDYTDYFGAGLASTYADMFFAIEVWGSRQKVESVRVSITNSPSTGDAKQLTILGVAAVISPKRGAFRIDNSRRMA